MLHLPQVLAALAFWALVAIQVRLLCPWWIGASIWTALASGSELLLHEPDGAGAVLQAVALRAALGSLYFWSVEQLDFDTLKGRLVILGGGVLLLVLTAPR